jgi:hypothetical protein
MTTATNVRQPMKARATYSAGDGTGKWLGSIDHWYMTLFVVRSSSAPDNRQDFADTKIHVLLLSHWHVVGFKMAGCFKIHFENTLANAGPLEI